MCALNVRRISSLSKRMTSLSCAVSALLRSTLAQRLDVCSPLARSGRLSAPPASTSRRDRRDATFSLIGARHPSLRVASMVRCQGAPSVVCLSRCHGRRCAMHASFQTGRRQAQRRHHERQSSEVKCRKVRSSAHLRHARRSSRTHTASTAIHASPSSHHERRSRPRPLRERTSA